MMRDIDRRLALLDIKSEQAKSLLPCPFCDADMSTFHGVMVFETIPRGINYSTYVRCPQCSAQGPSTASIEWAAAAWNGRAPNGERYKDRFNRF